MNGIAGGGLRYPLGSNTSIAVGERLSTRTSKATLDPRQLEHPVSVLRKVGKVTERRLHGLGIRTVRDLLLHLPFRHEPPSRITSVSGLCLNEEVTLRVRVLSCAVRETARRRVKVLEALVSDDSGSVLAIWYNQAYLEPAFRDRPEVLLKGVLVRQRGTFNFVVKRHEILGEAGESHHVLGLIPVYPSTADLSVRTIRTVLHEAAPYSRHLVDPLPAALRASRRYPGRAEAVLSCHFPECEGEAVRGRERLAFEELLLLQIAMIRRRLAQDSSRRARPLDVGGALTETFVNGLPFSPTGAQLKVISEIDHDLSRAVPMRRLLHGDVGSGKTMVAAYCMLRAVEGGGQAALMAPTEVLADQHYLRLSGQLNAQQIDLRLLKGSQASRERRETLEALRSGAAHMVVGTHALIQDGVRFQDLRVVIVDEQHRFGVRQREAMLVPQEGGLWPHTMHMSATPIPRTLSLTLYGDLDVSVLDELPPGRRPVRTRLVFGHSTSRMWDFVRAQLTAGRQAYVVCPLIEESDALQAASARQTYEELAGGELAGFRLGLLHGQLPAVEKATAMSAYVRGDVDALVCTSVIEVGVDVENATVMVILGARRFGMSQLHQLRGRVGRGSEESYCFLLVEEEGEEVLRRLALFARTTDGFALAEADLMARGEGQLFGERQSGFGDLEVASLIRDRRILEEARAVAQRLLCEGVEATGALPLLVEASERAFGAKMSWVERA